MTKTKTRTSPIPVTSYRMRPDLKEFLEETAVQNERSATQQLNHWLQQIKSGQLVPKRVTQTQLLRAQKELKADLDRAAALHDETRKSMAELDRAAVLLDETRKSMAEDRRQLREEVEKLDEVSRRIGESNPD